MISREFSFRSRKLRNDGKIVVNILICINSIKAPYKQIWHWTNYFWRTVLRVHRGVMASLRHVSSTIAVVVTCRCRGVSKLSIAPVGAGSCLVCTPRRCAARRHSDVDSFRMGIGPTVRWRVSHCRTLKKSQYPLIRIQIILSLWRCIQVMHSLLF